MSETMSQLKFRARRWPDPHGSHARTLIRDAEDDLAFFSRRHSQKIVEDLRQSLVATEQEMGEVSDDPGS